MFKLLSLISLIMVLCIVWGDAVIASAVPPSTGLSEEQQAAELETTVDCETDDASAPADVSRLRLTLRPPPAIVLTNAAHNQARLSSAIQQHTIPLPLTIATRPGLRTVISPETITIHEPSVAKVGEVLHQIPTAVSHQSQTIVHQHARVVTPIVAPLRAYHTPQVVRLLRAPASNADH